MMHDENGTMYVYKHIHMYNIPKMRAVFVPSAF